MTIIEYARNELKGAGICPESGQGLAGTNTCLRFECQMWDTDGYLKYPVLKPTKRYGHTYMCCPVCHASYGEVIERDRPTLGLSAAPAARFAMAQRLSNADGHPVMHLSFDMVQPLGQPRGNPTNISMPEDDARRLRDALIRQLGAP